MNLLKLEMSVKKNMRNKKYRTGIIRSVFFIYLFFCSKYIVK